MALKTIRNSLEPSNEPRELPHFQVVHSRPCSGLPPDLQPRAGGVQRRRHFATIATLCLVALALTGCGGGMSETGRLSSLAELAPITADIATARLTGSEFDMEQATRRYVVKLRGFVDDGFPKTEARRLLADLAVETMDCSACVAMLDRERQDLG